MEFGKLCYVYVGTWDWCYYFLNIFAKKSAKKIGIFFSKQSKIILKFDHNIGFWEKRRFFRQKWSKITENCDHNIDPCFGLIFVLVFWMFVFRTVLSPDLNLERVVGGRLEVGDDVTEGRRRQWRRLWRRRWRQRLVAEAGFRMQLDSVEAITCTL
jgi:hypothetical protein